MTHDLFTDRIVKMYDAPKSADLKDLGTGVLIHHVWLNGIRPNPLAASRNSHAPQQC